MKEGFYLEMEKQSPLFLEPVLQERIWGGESLKGFGYKLPSQLIGECWGISAHPNGESIVKNGVYAGLTLKEVWNRYPEIFGEQISGEFPLLTKILDANKDLSVQVHPNDSFASKQENTKSGKTECWYIISCRDGAEIIYGHHAKTKEEFQYLIENGEWEKLLRRVPIKPGDFFYVPSGTIHAICEGTVVLETQQSSDITYRVYDYDRVDHNGLTRELHLEKAYEVTTIPHIDYSLKKQVSYGKDVDITTYIKEEYFSVYKWEIKGEAILNLSNTFHLVSIIEGKGELIIGSDKFIIGRGEHFILPANTVTVTIKGEITAIVSHQ